MLSKETSTFDVRGLKKIPHENEKIPHENENALWFKVYFIKQQIDFCYAREPASV